MGFPSVTLPAAATACPPAAWDTVTSLAKEDQRELTRTPLTLLDLINDLLSSLDRDIVDYYFRISRSEE